MTTIYRGVRARKHVSENIDKRPTRGVYIEVSGGTLKMHSMIPKNDSRYIPRSKVGQLSL